MSPHRPRIGVTKCSPLRDYEESVRRAGGEPVVLDWESERAAEALARIDGLLLTGGADIDPARYGEAAHPTTELAPAARDAFELELARAAIAADLPTLAICRGMQVLNVAAGGTLVQDIPSELPSALAHDVTTPTDPIAHRVALREGSILSRVLGTSDAPVNSRHHQAVRRSGSGLTIAATAPDGVIEGIEKPDARFCVGVEWHPENFVGSGEFRRLFEALIEACDRARR